MRRHLYADNWEATSLRIRKRARGRCECRGECGLHRKRRCVERHGTAAKWARGKIVLTVHHLDFDKHHDAPTNLRAMCQRCHLRCDAPLRAERRKRSEDQKAGQTRLWPLATDGRPEYAQ